MMRLTIAFALALLAMPAVAKEYKTNKIAVACTTPHGAEIALEAYGSVNLPQIGCLPLREGIKVVPLKRIGESLYAQIEGAGVYWLMSGSLTDGVFSTVMNSEVEY